MVFSLAHLSDPHLPLHPGPLRSGPLRPGRIAPGGLSVKQVLALLAWRRKRRTGGTEQAEAALAADLAAHAPDHVAVTGDLVNLAAASEFTAARAWLQRLGPPGNVSVVPGNHDATVLQPWPSGLGQWEDFMRGDPGTHAPGAGPFPFLRRRGPLALIGLSTAVPTPAGFASGRLGAGQLAQLAVLLRQARGERLFRVVLIHHPPTMGEGGRRKALRDRAVLRAVLAQCGAELLLHGHHHVTRLVATAGPGGLFPACGVPHALGVRRGREMPGWRLYRVAREGAGWWLSAQGRQYDPASGTFRSSGAWTMHLPCAPA